MRVDDLVAEAAIEDVLRSNAPKHFAYFARTRLDAPAMAAKLDSELKLREAQVTIRTSCSRAYARRRRRSTRWR